MFHQIRYKNKEDTGFDNIFQSIYTLGATNKHLKDDTADILPQACSLLKKGSAVSRSVNNFNYVVSMCFCFQRFQLLLVFKFQFVGFQFSIARFSNCCFLLFDFHFLFPVLLFSEFWYPVFWFSILRLSHPRLRSFSITSRRFESRWVHSVLACFKWFCSASCRVRFNCVLPLCSSLIFTFETLFWFTGF